jgi:hypothetical protein
VATISMFAIFWKIKSANAHPISANFISNPHYEELVIEMPGINSKNENDIRTSLDSVSGVYYNSFCEQKKIMMFYVDRDVQADNSFLDNVLMPQGMVYYIKEGVSIKQIEYDCGITTEPATETIGR